MNRRQVLHTLCMASSALVFPWPSNKAYANNTLQWQSLDENTALVSSYGSHVLANFGNDGVCLVDGGHAAQADELLSFLASQFTSSKNPQLLFNSHWHRAQTGCNDILGKSGTTIIGHENTKLWLTTEVISSWEKQTYQPLPLHALPTQTFYYDTQKIIFNNQNIEYSYLPQGHTDGDICIHFPDKNILFAGDVVSGQSYPLLDYVSGGWIGGMITSLKHLINLADKETIIISSANGVCRLDDLKIQLQLCEMIIEKIAANYYQGLSFQDFINSKPSQDFDKLFGDPELFLHTAYEGAWGHIAELRNLLRRS